MGVWCNPTTTTTASGARACSQPPVCVCVPQVWLRRGVVEYPDVALLFSYSHNPSSGSPGRPGSSSNSSSDWTWAGEQLVVSSNDVGLADAATASGSGAATAAADVGAEEVVARLRGVAMTCPGGEWRHVCACVRVFKSTENIVCACVSLCPCVSC